MQPKLKMSNRKFRLIMFPLIALLMIVAIAATSLMNYFSASMNNYLGSGERTVKNVSEADSWNTDFYETKYDSVEEARAAAQELTGNIADEGIVLLKNNGILPLNREETVTPMGYRYAEPIYGGTGSGGTTTSADYIITPKEGIESAFTNVNTAVEEAMNKAEVSMIYPEGTVIKEGDNYSGASTTLKEYSKDVYETAADSMKGTTGLVFLGRIGGEGSDLYTSAYTDGTRHELALTEDEKALLQVAEENCENVVVMIESSTPMELASIQDDPEIDAILLVGGAGSAGFGSLGKILNGSVNPSGKLVDIYPVDFTKDPTYVNFDRHTGSPYKLDPIEEQQDEVMIYQNSTWNKEGVETGVPFHEYEEGVYLGYKYYETSSSLGYFTSANLPEGETDPYYNRDNGVVYPFGYGLSYTEFTQEITGFSGDEHTVNMTVRVTNAGDTAGKNTVQVYFNPPYTDFDIEYMIEKPTANLIAFAKTDTIEPGEYEDVTITIDTEDMASYCFTRDNGDGTTGCYVLEEGGYELSVRSDSHNVLDTKTLTIDETIWYDNSNPRQSEIDAQSAWDNNGDSLGYPEKSQENEAAGYIAATNQFEKANLYMTDDSVGGATILSRADWAGTQPTAPTDKDRIASDTVVEWNEWNTRTFDPETDEILGNVEGSLVYTTEEPVSNADNGLTIADMRGLDYYDEKWDLLLDQIDYSDIEGLSDTLFTSAYQTGKLDSVGKPASVDKDGPQNLVQMDNSGNDWSGEPSCSYTSEPVLAQTWNAKLAYEMGASMGQEALQKDVNCWYAPGVNIHRSPFSGRNFEYYSEDSYLTGIMAANVISGAGDNGLYCTMKHFALSDQESQRDMDTDCCIWATEQAMRENYLKAGEIAIKKAKKTTKYISDDQGTVTEKVMRATNAIMLADAAPGAEYTGWNYGFTENIMRGEWGFQGFIETDMGKLHDSGLDKFLRGGGDVVMTWTPSGMVTDLESATGKTMIRKAIKNLLYVQANSSLTEGVAPGGVITHTLAPWQIGLIIGDIIAAALVIGGVIWIIQRKKDENRHPDKYKSSEKKN